MEQPETTGDPLRHCGAFQLDTFSRIDLRLPIERQVVAVLRDQYLCQQPRSGEPTLDRTRRRFALHDALAAATGELRSHVLDNTKRRHLFENLGDILDDLAHRRSAITAGACGVCSM